MLLEINHVGRIHFPAGLAALQLDSATRCRTATRWICVLRASLEPEMLDVASRVKVPESNSCKPRAASAP
jgi:hypothetical protein